MKTVLNQILLLILCNVLYGQSLYFPPVSGNEWQTRSPTELNWTQDKIDSLISFLDSQETKAFLVLKNGKIVIEHYFDSFTADSNWAWFSAAKSLTAVLVGIAQQEDLLSIYDKTSDHLGEGWTSLSPDKEALITLWHQLTMTTGLDESVSFSCTDDSCLQYSADAGDRWFYHNAPYSLLRDVVENASGLNYNKFSYTRLTHKIGMNGLWIKAGDNNYYFSTARSMARFGLLMLNVGKWDNEILLDHNYIAEMINTSQELNPSYGYLWWLNGKTSYIPPGTNISISGSITPAAPSDMFAAAGALGQFISIVPSQNLVMVRIGKTSNDDLVPIELLNKIWQRLSAIITLQTDIPKTNPEIPSKYTLMQNYPNPFNGSTCIDYSIPKDSHVVINIYSVTGEKVVSINNSYQKAGNHTLVWAPTHLSSGIYYYQLTSNKIKLQKEMLYIK